MRDMEHQRQIIDTFVNSVYVFDDRVVLNFNFTDDSKTISREEVLGSSAVDNAPPRVPRPKGLGTFFVVDGTGREQHGTAAGGATNTPVGCLLVRGSQRLGMSTGMTAVLWWAVQDENRNEQRQGITMTVVSCLLL